MLLRQGNEGHSQKCKFDFLVTVNKFLKNCC